MKKTNFDWLSEEDEHFFDENLRTAKANQVFWRKTGIWVMALLAAGSLLIFYTLDRKQNALQNDERQNIQMSFNLWYDAVMDHDQELFQLALANENRSWINGQQKLFSGGVIIERDIIGLQVLEGNPINPDIDLSPDFQQAALNFEQPYQYSELGEGHTVMLRHSLNTMKVGDTWQFSPFDEDDWGQRQLLEGDYLHVEYRERDSDISQRLARDLNAMLIDECAVAKKKNRGADCEDVQPFTLVFSTDPISIQGFMHFAASLLEGKTILMPTPTLVGLPVDEEGYEMIFQAYARIISSHFDSYFNLPVPLPDESVYSLCFDFPNEGLRLFRYDSAEDSWIPELPGKAFYSLRAIPDDSAVILQEANSSENGNRLGLTLYQGGVEKSLINKRFDGPSYRPIGWAGSGPSPKLLLQQSSGQSNTNFGWLDVNSCSEGGCDINTSPGYPTWSLDGLHSLIVIGSEVFLGDENGQPVEIIGEGFNPFWMDSERFGFIRFKERGDEIVTELVMAGIYEPGLEVVLDGEEIGSVTGIGDGKDIFIQYAAANPVHSDRVIVSASGVRSLAGEYFVLTFQMEESNVNADTLSLLIRHQGTPGGTPASLTPTGFPPIDISPDGRWLLLSELSGESKSVWSYYFLFLENIQPPKVTESFPVLPAQFPFYDWSKDGRWLVIADHGFFRLVAPEYDFERLIPHDFDSCGFTVWGD